MAIKLGWGWRMASSYSLHNHSLRRGIFGVLMTSFNILSLLGPLLSAYKRGIGNIQSIWVSFHHFLYSFIRRTGFASSSIRPGEYSFLASQMPSALYLSRGTDSSTLTQADPSTRIGSDTVDASMAYKLAEARNDIISSMSATRCFRFVMFDFLSQCVILVPATSQDNATENEGDINDSVPRYTFKCTRPSLLKRYDRNRMA